MALVSGLPFRIFVVSVAWLMTCSLAAGQPKDTLYFHNKTVLVGKLRSVKLGYFEIDADGIGIVRIKNNKVSSLHAQSRNFRVETIGDSVMNGGFTRSSRPGWTIFHSQEKSLDIPIQDIAMLGYFGRTFRTRIDGNAGAGYSYTKSSEIGRVNANARIRYSSDRALVILEGDMIATMDSVAVEREREYARVSYFHIFPSVWMVGGYATYQRNLELGLARRWQEMIGGGRNFNPTPGQQGAVLSGVAINQEQNLEGIQNNNVEILLQLNYTLFSFEKPNASLNVVQTAYASMTEPGRYRSDGDINLSWELAKDFYVSLRFYHNFDSQSPATGAANVDWGTVAGLTYKF